MLEWLKDWGDAVIMVGRFFSALLISAYSLSVSAEGRCPPGYFPTTNPDFVGCAPIYNSGYDSGYSPSSAPMPPDPGPRWKFRWGAIVVDREIATFGGADGFERPSQAKKAAIKDCRTNLTAANDASCSLSITTSAVSWLLEIICMKLLLAQWQSK